MPNITIRAARMAIAAQIPVLVAKRRKVDGDWRVFSNPYAQIEYAIHKDDDKNLFEEIRINVVGYEEPILIKTKNADIESIHVGSRPLDDVHRARNSRHILDCLSTIRFVYIGSTKT